MPQVQERLEVDFDEDGLLLNPAQWNETVAQEIAWHDGIGQLTEEHWKVIHALREHYAKFGVAPAMSHLCRVHGKDRHWIHDLFHSCLGAWRVAGLPNPGEEAKAYMMQFRRDDRFAMCRCAISVPNEDWRDIWMTE